MIIMLSSYTFCLLQDKSKHQPTEYSTGARPNTNSTCHATHFNTFSRAETLELSTEIDIPIYMNARVVKQIQNSYVGHCWV